MDTTLRPPPLDLVDEDEDDPTIHLHLSITEADGTCRTASMALDATTATDVVLASALVDVMRGCAAMRGPGLAKAVERWVRR